MCGIVGFFTEEKIIGAINRKDIFSEMLFADTFRGWDSTGVVAINHDGKRRKKIFKRALAAPDFIATRSYKKLLASSSPKIMIGHNRAATKGSVDDDTAHPFQYGNITLVHNGTLQNTHNLPDFNSKGFTVDSDWIAYAINKWGVAEVAKQLQGSFSLVWYDSRDHSLNMLRNGDRPMNFAYLKDEKTVLFGSEAGLITWIAERNKEPIDEEGKIYTTTAGYWLKFTDKCRKYRAKKIEFYTPPKSNYNSTYYDRGTQYLPFKDRIGMRGKTEDNVLGRIDPALTKGQSLLVAVEHFEKKDNVCTYRHDDYPAVKFKCYGEYRNDIDFEYLHHGGDEYLHSVIISAAYERNMGNSVYKYIVACSTPVATNILAFDGEGDDEENGELSEKDNVIKLPSNDIEWIFAPDKKLITTEEFRKLTKAGCMYCSNPIDIKDANNVSWDKKKKKPVCMPCSTNYIEYVDKPEKVH